MVEIYCCTGQAVNAYADAVHKSMTTTPPRSTSALDDAARLVATGRLVEAEAAYRAVVAADAQSDRAYHGLALIAFRVGKLVLAAELLESAIALAPSVATYRRDRGEICRRLGRMDEALAEAREAVRLAPADPEAHYNHGVASAERGDIDGAIASYRRAIALDARHGRAQNNLGTLLERRGDPAGAAEAYRAAIAIDPQHMEAHNNLGAVLSSSGDLDGARTCFERALALEPRSIEAHFNLSTLKRYTADAAAVPVLESLAADLPALPLERRVQLLFTLGKMRDDLGRYEAAFAAYAEGNRLQASTLRVDEAQADAAAARMVARFPREVFSRAPIGNLDPTPVFIVGMPRSGTSLVEQILASHPDVHGAGEIKDFHELVVELSGASRSLGADEQSAMLAALGARYLAGLRARAPVARRITDKLPGNFQYLGLIHLALPNAKIVHVVRDPLDTCLSCYTHLFKETMEFAYDLGTLGRYYARYRALMRHWRSVLPCGVVLDVRYEALVDDIERETRRMLDHVGLPWDARCLAFHRNERPVRTASLAQVRQPIYRTSVGAWRRFERQLAGLRAIVDEPG